MNTSTNQMSFLVSTQDHIQINRMLITDILITQDTPSILYQVPFILTKFPRRVWKEVLMDSWQSVIQQNEHASKTVLWMFHNRIFINKVPIELVKDEIEILLSIAIEKTNKQMKTRSQHAI